MGILKDPKPAYGRGILVPKSINSILGTFILNCCGCHDSMLHWNLPFASLPVIWEVLYYMIVMIVMSLNIFFYRSNPLD